MNIYILNLPAELKWHNFKKYVCYVSKERIIKTNKYISDNKKLISLFSEIFVRFCLIYFFNINNETIEFNYGENQKPFLKKNNNLYFSISHSINTIGVAIDNNPIGLDPEIERTIDLDIISAFYSRKESFEVFKDKNIYKNFWQIWTQKEARVKLFGKNFLYINNTRLLKKCFVYTGFYKLKTNNIIFSIASDTKSNVKVKNICFEKMLEKFELYKDK